MSNEAKIYTHYRESLLGKALIQTIQKANDDHILTSQQIENILPEFDKVLPLVAMLTVFCLLSV